MGFKRFARLVRRKIFSFFIPYVAGLYFAYSAGLYELFPKKEDWRGKILLLESSEEKPSPEKYAAALEYLKRAGVFDAVSGVLAGKPMDNVYAEEYKRLLKEVIDDPLLPVVFNLNVGHAMPRCIIPFGVEAEVDADKQVIRFAK